MVEISLEPADAWQAVGIEPFVQTIRLSGPQGGIGTATWHCGDLGAGVVQIVNLAVEKAYQRQGHGGKLLAAVIQQAGRYHLAHKSRLRRLWMGIAQKTQVNARAFATTNGFTHVGAVQQLLREQDMLIYMRTFD